MVDVIVFVFLQFFNPKYVRLDGRMDNYIYMPLLLSFHDKISQKLSNEFEMIPNNL